MARGCPLGKHRAGSSCPAHTPLTIPAGFLDRRPEPEFDQAQHVPVDDPPQYRLQQVTVGDRVEGLGQISVDNIRVTATEKLVDHLGRIARRAFRSVTIGTGVEIGLEDRLDHKLDGTLNHPVPYRRDTERPRAATGLGDQHSPNRLWAIGLATKLIPDPGQPILQPCRLDHREAHPIHPRRTLVGTRQTVGMVQDVFTPDLVVELI